MYSFYSIKRVSAFRLMPIGKVITYLFLLMALSFLPNVISAMLGNNPSGDLTSLPIPLPISYALVYLFATGYKFVEVSILAVLGLMFAKMLHKPLTYIHTWILATYATTAPTLILSILDSITTLSSNVASLLWFVAATYLYFIIRAIPSPKK